MKLLFLRCFFLGKKNPVTKVTGQKNKKLIGENQFFSFHSKRGRMEPTGDYNTSYSAYVTFSKNKCKP